MKNFIYSKTIWGIALLDSIPYLLVGLLARLAIAPVFFRSGQTKVDGFQLRENAVVLFQYEYGLPYPYVMAHLAAIGELTLPVLLILGIATRFAAAGLFVMTLVIQFVYPEGWWSHHALWLALLAVLISKGGGAFSLDYLIKRTIMPTAFQNTRPNFFIAGEKNMGDN